MTYSDGNEEIESSNKIQLTIGTWCERIIVAVFGVQIIIKLRKNCYFRLGVFKTESEQKRKSAM